MADHKKIIDEILKDIAKSGILKIEADMNNNIEMVVNYQDKSIDNKCQLLVSTIKFVLMKHELLGQVKNGESDEKTQA